MSGSLEDAFSQGTLGAFCESPLSGRGIATETYSGTISSAVWEVTWSSYLASPNAYTTSQIWDILVARKPYAAYRDHAGALPCQSSIVAGVYMPKINKYWYYGLWRYGMLRSFTIPARFQAMSVVETKITYIESGIDCVEQSFSLSMGATLAVLAHGVSSESYITQSIGNAWPTDLTGTVSLTLDDDGDDSQANAPWWTASTINCRYMLGITQIQIELSHAILTYTA